MFVHGWHVCVKPALTHEQVRHAVARPQDSTWDSEAFNECLMRGSMSDLAHTDTYCQTPHEMAPTAAWQGGDHSVYVRGVWIVYEYNLHLYAHKVFKRPAEACVRLYVCLSVHVRARGRSAWLSSAWAGQSLICHSRRSTDTRPKQTDIKTERKASLCSSAVQFVLTLSGGLSSPLILMSSPGFRLTGGLGRREGSEGDVKPPAQTLTSAHRQKLAWAEKCVSATYCKINRGK